MQQATINPEGLLIQNNSFPNFYPFKKCKMQTIGDKKNISQCMK